MICLGNNSENLDFCQPWNNGRARVQSAGQNWRIQEWSIILFLTASCFTSAIPILAIFLPTDKNISKNARWENAPLEGQWCWKGRRIFLGRTHLPIAHCWRTCFTWRKNHIQSLEFQAKGSPWLVAWKTIDWNPVDLVPVNEHNGDLDGTSGLIPYITAWYVQD